MRRRPPISVPAAIALEAALTLMPSWGAGTRGLETDIGAWAACSAAEYEVARNAILFIGDGMGPGQLAAVRLARYGCFAVESMPVKTTVTTLSWGGKRLSRSLRRPPGSPAGDPSNRKPPHGATAARPQPQVRMRPRQEAC